MAAAEQPLPEGTDHIINGATAFDADPSSTGQDADYGESDEEPAGRESSKSGPSDNMGGGKGAFFDRIEDAKTQGIDRAREYAVLGKDRATGALDDVVRMINDAAGQVDSKVGSQYGDYARRAADGLTSFNAALKDKDVDDLFNDARELVAKAPAVTVGAAAALGFIVARLAKAGLDPASAPSKDAPPA